MPTTDELRKGFALGSWEVLPDRGIFRDGDVSEHVEPKVMDVLVELAARQGEVLSKELLIETVWEGRAQSDEPLNRCISLLRRKLGDDSRKPTYVENIPRRGYRLMQPVRQLDADSPAEPESPEPRRGLRPAWIAGGALLAAAFIFVIGRMDLGTRSTADAPIQSIAIYPFTCADGTEEYLCFGFSEELTSTLLRAERIRIVKRINAIPTDAAYQTIAVEAGVDGLLTGSVQRIGDRVRIAAELVDGRDGFVVVSDTLDGSVAELFRLQEEVAGAVARSIFGEDGAPLTAASQPSSFEAFEAYARGQYQFERRSRATLEEAVRLFEDTIRLDPAFGPAYLRLAYAYLLLPEYDSSLSIEDTYDLAAATAQQGIAVDPGIRDAAGTVFGFIHHKRGEWLEATRAFESVIAAGNANPLARHWYSRLLATVGRMDEALQQSRRAYELDPDRAIVISRLAITNFWVSDLDAARRYFDIANTMDQDSPIHDLAYALYLIRTDDITAARDYTRSGLRKYGFDAAWVDTVFDGIEDPALRPQAVDLVVRLEADGKLAGYIVLTLWSLLGEVDRAMRTAQSLEGIGQQFETGFEILFSDELRVLRQHDAFPALLDDIGLTEYWAAVGCERVGDRDRVRCN